MALETIGQRATIDEALSKTHFGKFNYFVIIVSGLILFNVVLESVGVSFALPILECDLNLSYKEQGIIGAISFIGIIASSHFWGFLADTQGRRRIILPALITQFVITLLSSFSPNFETFAVLRFLNGFFLSAASATIFAYLGEFHCQRYRNRALLSAAFMSSFSAIFFPIIAWFFINQNWEFYVPYFDYNFKPWRSYFIACGVPGFICGLLFLKLPESPKYLLGVGRKEEALEVIRHIHKMNIKGNAKIHNETFNVIELIPDWDTPTKVTTNVSDRNAVITVLHSMWNQTAPLFMREHIRKTFIASLIQFIQFFTAHGVYMWFPYILNNTMQFTQRYAEPKCLCDILRFTQSENFTVPGTDKNEICVTHLEISTYKHSIVLEVIYISILLCVCYAVTKYGRKPILFMILLFCGACGIASLMVTLPIVAIYLFVVLLCCGVGTTVLNAIVVDIYPTNLRAMAVCISLMMGRIGSVTGSNVLGALIDTNCDVALYGAAVSLIIASFLGVLLPKAKANITHKSNETA